MIDKRNVLLILAFFMLLPCILVPGFYIYHFFLINNFSLSNNPEQWGQFGDYFGGTLNPAFAFLAFIGVLLTVYLQSEQLKIVKAQTLIEEIQRLIASVSQELDSLFQQSPKVLPDEFSEKSHPFTIFSLLSAIGTAVLKDVPNADTLRSKSLHCIDLELRTIVIELNQLTWALQKYELAGGSVVVIEFYRKRYEVSTCWLNTLGFIDRSGRIFEFFKPDELSGFLK
ncbi:MAG: hypothetical protein ACXW1P_00245 [Methylophilaceae bacterium]